MLRSFASMGSGYETNRSSYGYEAVGAPTDSNYLQQLRSWLQNYDAKLQSSQLFFRFDS